MHRPSPWTLLCCVVVLNAVTLAAVPAQAAGYAIREQSPAAQGNAFAGATAGAEDISYAFFNPAGLTRHRGDRVLSALSFIAPQSNFDASGASTVTGSPISGGEGGSDVGADASVPSLYGLWSVTPDLKLGLGINAPFGLATEYDSDWVGRYHSLESELQSLAINPMVAYRPFDELSLGAGLQIARSAVRLTNAIDFGTLDQVSFGGAFGGTAGASDGFGEVEGKDWGFGFTLGLLYEPTEDTRLGIAYRSKITHDISGNATFLPGGAVGGGIAAASGAFVNTSASAELILPETLSVGAYHQLTADWAIMGEAAWTNWSRVKELRVRFDNPAQGDSVTVLDWHDSWFFALGTSYRILDKTTLRLGVAYEQTPVPTRTRTPRLADEARTWISLGLSYQPLDNLLIEAGYSHIFLPDARLRLTTADPNNIFRGNLAGRYDSAIDIVSLQARLRF